MKPFMRPAVAHTRTYTYTHVGVPVEMQSCARVCQRVKYLILKIDDGGCRLTFVKCVIRREKKNIRNSPISGCEKVSIAPGKLKEAKLDKSA